MKIRFNSKQLAPEEAVEFKTAVNWAVMHLGIADKDYTLDIRFLEGALLGCKSTVGYFMPFELGLGEIGLKRTKKMKSMRSTVFHELVHCQQVITGRLLIDPGRAKYWNMKRYNVKDEIGYFEYRNLPWEQDARMVANQMEKEWRKMTAVKGKFWKVLLRWLM